MAGLLPVDGCAQGSSSRHAMTGSGHSKPLPGPGGPVLKVVCLGACHLDRKARAMQPYMKSVSNPAVVDCGFGGVARNVAENLHRLGVSVALVSRVAEDSDGLAVADQLRGLSIGLEHLSFSSSAPTAFHLIALEPDGEMLVGLADMRIYDEISPSLLRRLPASLWQGDAVFADCNLPSESLAYIAAQTRDGCALAINGVSPAKVVRARAILSAVDLLFLNRAEAAALAESGQSDDSPEVMAEALLARGVREVVITLGAAGFLVAGAEERLRITGQGDKVEDVTGAGDALAAAYLEARLRGLEVTEAVRLAEAAARLTLESRATVSPELSAARLKEMG